MLKSIMVGDIVKVKDGSFGKFCDVIGMTPENRFEVKYIDFDSKAPLNTRYVISVNGEKKLGLKKNVLEVIVGNTTILTVDDKLEEMLCFNNTGKEILNLMKKCNIRSIEKDFLSFNEKDKMITYIPYEKLKNMGFKYYDEKLRAKYAKPIKPIKIIQEILLANPQITINLSQEIIDNLLSCVNKEINAKLILVSGPDISKYYSEEYYMAQTGTLGNSCMKYKKYGKAGVFHLYEDSAEMLILKDNNSDKIYGRAIVWTLKGETEYAGRKFVDRIYTTNDAFVGIFKQFAFDNNMLCLDKQAYGTHTFVDNGQSINVSGMDIYVEINPRINGYMFHPYIDTFFLQGKTHMNRLYHNGVDEEHFGKLIANYHRTCGRRETTSAGRQLGLRDGGSLDD